MGIRPAPWNSKNKIYIFLLVFFLLYIIWIPHNSETIKYINIDKYVYTDIYTEIAWTFSLAITKNEYRERERERERERTGKGWFI